MVGLPRSPSGRFLKRLEGTRKPGTPDKAPPAKYEPYFHPVRPYRITPD